VNLLLFFLGAVVLGIILYFVLRKVAPTVLPPPPPPPPPGGGILPNGMKLTLVVKTTSVAASDVAAYVGAQQAQLDKDFSPVWGGDSTISGSAGGWPVYLEDVSDVQGALGYHDVDAAGVPYARVFVKTSEGVGVSWESVASHEVLEMLADANANTTVPGPDGCNWYREVGDPCEDRSYERNGVELSDFVLPSWFSESGQGPFDYLWALSAPFTVTSGGYAASDCGQVTGSEHANKGWSVDKDYD
jgi:hypothetical protein